MYKLTAVNLYAHKKAIITFCWGLHA